MNGSVKSVTLTPPLTASTAAAICPASFTAGDRSSASSVAPTSAIRQAPAATHQVWTVPPVPLSAPTVRGRWIASGSQMAAATRTPIRIARPPSCGVSFWARPRSVGLAVAPIRRASLAASGVSTVAMTIATRNANTASQ